MSRGVHAFREADIAKVLRATRNQGLNPQRIEIDRNGKITIDVANEAPVVLAQDTGI